MDEVDARIGGAALGLRITGHEPRPRSIAPSRRRRRSPDRELLQAGPAAVDELGDRRLLVQWGEELDDRAIGALRSHCLTNALFVVDFFVQRG